MPWLTPFARQCLVTTGVAMNVGQFGLVMGFTAILLPQLRGPKINSHMDDYITSWIAAIPSVGLVLGNLTIPIIMGKFGRKIGNSASAIIAVIGWLCIMSANTAMLLLIGRFLQGISMGMTTSLGPILIAEYTSPKYRGSFLATTGLATSVMTLIVHTVGVNNLWQTTAVVCCLISTLDVIIVLFSPESPSWLAEQGRTADCERVFYLLRGDADEDELKTMLETSQVTEFSGQLQTSVPLRLLIPEKIRYFFNTIAKKEIYMPIFIVIHLYMIVHWGGINILSAYTLDTFEYVIKDQSYDAMLIAILDVQRIIAGILAIYFMRKAKRRTMLFFALIVNILALVLTGVYSYVKMNGLLGYDHYIFGTVLMHIHSFSVMVSSSPLPMVIAGELFPMRHRSLCGGVSALFYSLHFFINLKTVMIMFDTVKLYGAYFIYAGMLTYCFVIIWFFLPETKDRTLDDIEKEFKGKNDDLKSAQPLNTFNQTSN